MSQHNTICLIVAAGTSTRFSGENGHDIIPKQYVSIKGQPIIRRCVQAFLNNSLIDNIRVVYNPEHQELYKNAISDLDILSPVQGGKTRQESVYNGLLSLEEFNPKKVLIHDAARPLIDNEVITNIVQELDTADAVIPAIQIVDTIKRCKDNIIKETLDRSELFKAQTPQGFNYKEIIAAHKNCTNVSYNFTDDASIFEYLDKKVKIVPGSSSNFKITSQNDLKMAEALL